MKSLSGVVAAMVLLASAVSYAADPANDNSVLKTQKDKVSYSIGMSIAESLKRGQADLDVDLLLRGLRDVMTASKALMSSEEVEQTMMAFQKEMAAKGQERAKVDGEKNRKAGEDFLTANKKKEGVITLPSGLQYKVLKEGTGALPKATDTVSVHYRGTLLDGTEFDSSYKREQPVSFPVNGVIPGWVEALQLMKVGSKWQLFIASALGYGERGFAPQIGPNATLIFEVELLGIEGAK